MNKIKIKDIIKSINGNFIKQDSSKRFIKNISIDSRNVSIDSLFFCIIGEKLDGHNFLKDAYDNGCRNFVIDNNHECNLAYNDINVISVNDTTISLGNLAKYYRSLFDIHFIGVTGSVGKTTTKDMIHAVLSIKYNTLKTEGNFNNDLGLPRTLFNLNNKTEVAVIEMGMSNKGEIKYLADILNPSIAVISNIGMSHIMNFKNQTGIFNAKMEITNNFNKDNILIINGDDKYLKKLRDKKKEYKLYSYGFNINNDIYCKSYEINQSEIDFICVYNKKEYSFSIPTIAKHNIYNSLASILIGFLSNMTQEEITKGLAKFKQSKERLNIENINKLHIINDAYNASSMSMISALDVLSSFKTRKIAVLGDILELGKYSEAEHRKVGKMIGKDIDLIITIGNDSNYIINEAIKKGYPKERTYHFKTNEEAKELLLDLILKDDTILVKASHGIHLEEVVDFLKDMKLK